jgi:Tol biopolymer transport system component
MGEVYRATDTKLGRDVAIKILPSEVAGDSERLARFQREAHLLASLNHPHIAAIYGLEEAGGKPFLVLELVEGEDLQQRLERGAIPVEEALEIARQIAEGLEGAHEKGIVHRDLKPANVMLTPDGKVKVLDFGLAKAWEGDPVTDSSSGLSQSPTLAHSGTQAGVILGTAAYMSPEQARGKPVDKRADNWGFGVLLFEMLAGRRLFSGETVSDVLAAVLKEEPPWEELPQPLPPGTTRVLRRCLRKSPRERFHDIADVRIELEEVLDDEMSRSGAPLATPRSRWQWTALPWVVALAATAVAVWTGLGTMGGPAIPQTVVASILPPPGAEFLVDRGLALSPDGRQLVFAAREGEGPDGLWLRPLGDGAARRLAGTEEGHFPFWSPDGRHVAFFASGALKRIEVETGLVESLADYTSGWDSGGAWSPQGGIVFGSEPFELDRVQGRGGEPEVALPAQGHVDRLWPGFLSDGKRFLFLARDYRDDSPLNQLRVGSLDGKLDEAVMRLSSNAVHAPSGHLVWWQDGNLRVQHFDAARLAVEGESRVLAAGVQFDPSRGLGAFSLAGTTLVYREGGLLLQNELVRLSRSGEELGPVSPPGNYYHPRLSPDGSRVVVDRSDETNRGDIWIYDVERATGTRLTTAPENETAPVWSPDGTRLAHTVAYGNSGGIRVRPAGGSGGGDKELSVTGGRPQPSSWSPGGLLLVDHDDDIWVYALEDDSFSAYLETPFSETSSAWSADGRLVAYDSDETGGREVYIQTFPDPGRRWRVSTDGGHSPVWNRDGGEIYYVHDDALMAVSVQGAASAENQADIRLGPPRVLFRVDLKNVDRRQYDTLDGETFIVNRNRPTGSTTPLTLVLNVDLDRGIQRTEP